MINPEDIKKEIDRVPPEKLDRLYKYVRGLAEIYPKKRSRAETIARMSSIRIDAPTDFATNIDEYLYFGKKIEK